MLGGQVRLMLAYADGVFPILFFVTMMPITAPACPVTPMYQPSSRWVRHISLPVSIRSFSSWPYAALVSSMHFFIAAGGSLPAVPSEANHLPYSGLHQLLPSTGMIQPELANSVSVPSL